ncbi:MAG: acetyltransferase, partial [Lachnospiraceae bacterium]|nr:acetyltransferase [Lachnospiraceae bacterium]
MNLISKEKVAIRLMNSTDNDMNFILRWLTNPEVIAWVYDEDAPWDIDKVKIKFARKADGLGSAIPCFIMYDDKAIGYLQYYPLEEDSYIFNSPETFREIEGGYGLDMFIGEPGLWDKGIGSVVVNLIGEYLKAEQGVNLLCVDPATDNPRAVHFWQKVGFRQIDIIKNYDDENKDSI